MPGKLNLIGERFGHLVVLEDAGHVRFDWGTRRAWRCRCDCGEVCVKPTLALRSGDTSSCGCFRKKVTGAARRTHGASGGDEARARTYRIWKSMRRRCRNPADAAYLDYGGRGISVCPAWASYEAFEADMGIAPPGYSIERIDVNGNYEPANCKWIPRRLQSRNRRDTRYVEYRGEILNLAEACEHAGFSATRVHTMAHDKRLDHQTAFDVLLARKEAA